MDGYGMFYCKLTWPDLPSDYATTTHDHAYRGQLKKETAGVVQWRCFVCWCIKARERAPALVHGHPDILVMHACMHTRLQATSSWVQRENAPQAYWNPFVPHIAYVLQPGGQPQRRTIILSLSMAGHRHGPTPVPVALHCERTPDVYNLPF